MTPTGSNGSVRNALILAAIAVDAVVAAESD